MDYTLDIDGYIGDWYNSKTRVKEILAKNKSKEVSVRINSLGGDLDHGLDIAEQFAEHGDVIVNLVSFNASAATIATLGAKRVRMQADSFYLIHKVMSWVDNWGYMNEDDIQEVIDKLSVEKKENEKVTLQLARKYSARTGKSVVDILNLMKEETWLNAEEAKDWGFVDEIYGKSTGKVNFENMAGKFNALGLPISDRFTNSEADTGIVATVLKLTKNLEAKIDALSNRFSNDTSKTNIQNTKIAMKKDWTRVNAILGVEGVNSESGTVNLKEEDIAKINESLEETEKKLGLSNTAKEKAEKDLETLKAEFEAYKNAKGDTTGGVKRDTDAGGKENVFGREVTDAQSMYNLLKQK